MKMSVMITGSVISYCGNNYVKVGSRIREYTQVSSVVLSEWSAVNYKLPGAVILLQYFSATLKKERND